jgi:hypothetical protein
VSSGWDHVPPLHFVSRLSYEARRHYWLRLLPACRECNSWLGGIIKTTAADRRIHVRRHLRKKYARLLSIPEWDEVELNHLSEKLQHDIRSKLRAAAFIRQRIGFHGSTRIFEYS